MSLKNGNIQLAYNFWKLDAWCAYHFICAYFWKVYTYDFLNIKKSFVYTRGRTRIVALFPAREYLVRYSLLLPDLYSKKKLVTYR